MAVQTRLLERQATELEAQQTALRATEAWYRGIIEASPDGMLVVGADGRILMTNPQLDALFGNDQGELVGSGVERLVPEHARERHAVLRNGFITSGTTRQMGLGLEDLRGVRKDGSLFSVEIGLSHLPNLEGRGVCVCASASVRDVRCRSHCSTSTVPWSCWRTHRHGVHFRPNSRHLDVGAASRPIAGKRGSHRDNASLGAG